MYQETAAGQGHAHLFSVIVKELGVLRPGQTSFYTVRCCISTRGTEECKRENAANDYSFCF